MANIVTSLVAELLPEWLQSRRRRQSTEMRKVPVVAVSKTNSASQTKRQSARPAHRPKPDPAHWRASSM